MDAKLFRRLSELEEKAIAFDLKLALLDSKRWTSQECDSVMQGAPGELAEIGLRLGDDSAKRETCHVLPPRMLVHIPINHAKKDRCFALKTETQGYLWLRFMLPTYLDEALLGKELGPNSEWSPVSSVSLSE